MTLKEFFAATVDRPVRVGRYDVVGLIGRGGMGAVFDAIDCEHGLRVALKTLTHLKAENLLRFKSEFRFTADLSHPNLVSLYELGCHDDLWFFTMERIEGVDFIAWLRGDEHEDASSPDVTTKTVDTVSERRARSRDLDNDVEQRMPSLPPDLPRLRDALSQLVRGVRALHAAALVHLDLKPSNVLVDRNGRVVIVDFGLVRAIEAGWQDAAQTESSPTVGTPKWMAPEQYTGIGIGAPTDWYAVGLMLYLALTGVRAFRVMSPNPYLQRYYRPPSPEQLLAGVPIDLSDLANALLELDPERRPDGNEVARIASNESKSALGAAPRSRSRSEVVGRAAERALLERALHVAMEGGAAVIHLSGASGVGKSSLVQCLVDDASRGDSIVLRGRCYERETVPYKAFDEMLDQLAVKLSLRADAEVQSHLPNWIVELARVFPVLAKINAVSVRVKESATASEAIPIIELRRRAMEALPELLASLAAHQPLVLAIDDLQWADADSCALLVKLVEAPAPRGLLLAASLRPDEAAASVAVAGYLHAAREFTLREDIHFVAIDVQPLARAEAERLASLTLSALDASDPELSARIASEAAGVPLFVEELAHYAAHERASGRIASTEGITLENVLARRVQGIASAERAVVEVLAVANSPIPLSVCFSVAGIAGGEGLRALWSLNDTLFVRSSGTGADDRVELHHDRMREAVLGTLSKEQIEDRHLALGRSLAARDAATESGAWLFDSVRHLNSVPHRLLDGERLDTARLNLSAARRAHRAASFPLAFDCFLAGTKLQGEKDWSSDYDLALALHRGAAETACLSAAWGELDALIAIMKTRGRTILDQLAAWEVEIDACIARNRYLAAVEVALEALHLLGVDLPSNPGEAEVGAELTKAMVALASVGPEGLAARAIANDETIIAAMRIQTRICSAAYFARPMLLAVIACRLVTTSIERGLTSATPYALSVFAIVLNTIGKLAEGHRWGRVALGLIERFDDRSLEARTRHVVHDLVCTWTVPLAGTLDDLRAVVAIAQRAGDLEYAAYAAHAYVHNAFYAARPLEALLDEALAYGQLMRRYEQVNALHVHTPFEQVLRCFTGNTRDPARLDGDGFSETAALDAARTVGSRSAECIVRLLMGIVRFHFGDPAEASECFELARPFLDGVASTWHVPMFHQYAALSIHALPDEPRKPLIAQAEASLAALRNFTSEGAGNFAHRVLLVEATSALAEGNSDRARERFAAATEGARSGGWQCDLGLAHELKSRGRGVFTRSAASTDHAHASREAYARWGATAKVLQLQRR